MLQIIKPRTLGILTKPERRRGGVAFVVSALGLFDLTSPDDFMSEQAIWPMVAEELPQGQVLDLAMPKPCGEVLVAGKAMAPFGQAVKAMTVDVQIATVAKRIAVFGDRFWQPTSRGVVFTEPQPFVEMPLEPARSFGGPSHPANPAGRGYQAGRLVASGDPVPMPNVEDVRYPIRSIDDSPPPVRLGPIDPGSPERRRYARPDDAEWLKHDFPGLPQDVDPRLFLVAPDDQWIQGYFKGDEPLRVAGFSAKHPEVVSRLPAMTVRAIIERTCEPKGNFEIDLRIDTVWLFPSQNKGLLIYRGALATQDIDGRDVKTILLAYERMGTSPRPVSHYIEQIRLRTNSDPKDALKHLLADQHLRPLPDPAEAERRRQVRIAYNRKLAERHAEATHYFMQRQAAKAGLPAALLPDPAEAEPPPFLVPSPEDVERGEVDLAELIDGIEKFATEKRAELEQRAKEFAGELGETGKPASLTEIDALIARLAPGAAGDGGVRGALESVRQSIVVPEGGEAESAEAARAGLARIDGLLDGSLAPPAKDEEAQFAEAAARFNRLPEASPLHPARMAVADARARIGDTPEPPADWTAPASRPIGDVLASIELGDGAPEHARAALDRARPRIEEANAKIRAALPKLEGASPLDSLLAALPAPENEPGSPSEWLAARLDSTEARLETAAIEVEDGLRMVRRLAPVPTFPREPFSPRVARRLGDFALAELRGGRSLAAADLAGVDLRGADLSGLDLRGAMFERADLREARLAGADCTEAVFAGADLTGADLSRTDLTKANFGSAILEGARFAGATLKAAVLLDARPAGADFSGALLEDLQILKLDLSRIRLDGARLRNVMALDCTLTGFSARRADFEACQFLQADAAEADLTQARMHRCAFLGVHLPRSLFTEIAIDTVTFLGGCDITGADFTGAKARNVGFLGAILAGACFDYARFDESSFMEADLSAASFRLASLRGSMFSSAKLAGGDLFGANLLQGQLRRSDLAGASLRHANLYTCDLSDATLTSADFSFANLGKTRLEVASQ